MVKTMLDKLLHKYIVTNNDKTIKQESDWIDVSNWTIGQVQEVSKQMDIDYPNNWYVKIKRIVEA